MPTRPHLHKFGTSLPCVYNGCKIYAGSGRFRVVPFPGLSVYDRTFMFNDKNKSKVWGNVIDYCKKPSIPKSSANYVK